MRPLNGFRQSRTFDKGEVLRAFPSLTETLRQRAYATITMTIAVTYPPDSYLQTPILGNN